MMGSFLQLSFQFVPKKEEGKKKHNRSFLLTLALENGDMCHGTIGFGMIKIEVPYRVPMGS
jgi:hypothetical protein